MEKSRRFFTASKFCKITPKMRKLYMANYQLPCIKWKLKLRIYWNNHLSGNTILREFWRIWNINWPIILSSLYKLLEKSIFGIFASKSNKIKIDCGVNSKQVSTLNWATTFFNTWFLRNGRQLKTWLLRCYVVLLTQSVLGKPRQFLLVDRNSSSQ